MGPPTSRDEEGEDRRARQGASQLLHDTVIDARAAAMVENQWACAAMEPLTDEAGGGGDLLVTVFPLIGHPDALDGLTLCLEHLTGEGVTRFGRLTRRGRVVFTDLAPGQHRARLVEPRPFAPLARVGGGVHATAVVPLQRAPAARVAAGPAAHRLLSADGTTEFRFRNVGGALQLELRAPSTMAGWLLPLEFEGQDADPPPRTLLVALAEDDAQQGSMGDAWLGRPPNELTVTVGEPIGPEALGQVQAGAVGAWKEPVERSVAQAAYQRDLDAWRTLAESKHVLPALRETIRLAIRERL